MTIIETVNKVDLSSIDKRIPGELIYKYKPYFGKSVHFLLRAAGNDGHCGNNRQRDVRDSISL